MEVRLADTERIIAELQSEPVSVTHTPVHVRTDAPMHTLRLRATVDMTTFGVWLGWAFGTLHDQLVVLGATPSGPAGGLYGPQILDDGPEEVEAFIPVAEPLLVGRNVAGVALGELPERNVAVLVHAGSYETISETYRTLGAWVARHAEHAGERIREWYLIGPDDTPEPDGFRTEIAWPVVA
jgi:hypothetical protein